jgi:hypothetical protein
VDKEDSLLTDLAATAVSVTLDESLAGLFEKVILSESQGGGGWWGVVDLVNPAQTFQRFRSPGLRKSREIERKLLYGKYVHEQLAPAWFRELPGFALSEGSVDGANVGLGGIRGRIDFRLGRSIVEFKTTELTHEDVADVWSKTPQDLEQLLFYALMTNRAKESHTLVYYRQNEEAPFRAFRVTLLEPGPIKEYLLKRKAGLEAAIANGSPKRAGRCRYYDTGCDYRTQSICQCEKLPPLDTQALEATVRLDRDHTMEGELSRVRRATPPLPRTRVRAWDLFVPRQAFRDLTDPKPFENRLFDEDYSQRVWLERKITDSQIAGKFGVLRLKGIEADSVSLGWSGTLVFDRTTKSGVETREVPFLLRVPKADRPKDFRGMPDAYLGQLALRCSLLGTSEGVVALVFPRSSYQTLCWRVSFKDQEGARAKLEHRLRDLMVAIKKSDPENLPLCLTWVREDCGEGCLCPRARARAVGPARES